MRFNVKSKANYDKEYGSNEVYQFVFGQEFLDLINQAQLRDRALMEDEDDMDEGKKKIRPTREVKSLDDLEVRYPH